MSIIVFCYTFLVALTYWQMSLPHWLVILSALVSISGASVYIRNTLKGATKPNRITWFIWAFAPLVGTAAALASHADPWATTRIFLAGFLPLLVVVASYFNPKSYWQLTVFDFICGALSLTALIVWIAAGLPRYAILLAAVGDFFAALPTIRKAWRHPETESGIVYLGSLISVLLILPSIPRWNIENSAFQIYLLVVNILLIMAVYRKRLLP